ncbi:MAG: HipA domain-containing protein, partial [Desulfovibrionaceae bacterium]|nr:HipA domain-containing protein [Desulfovibrionaceae bacterium]
MRRFDREGERRRPFLSAASLLQKTDGETGSYAEMAQALMQAGMRPGRNFGPHADLTSDADCRRDLAELWARMVFNMLIHNTDDHLRNHG